jgi:hypothetical protein
MKSFVLSAEGVDVSLDLDAGISCLSPSNPMNGGLPHSTRHLGSNY